MYQSLEPVKLRSGETVEAGFFRAPNLDWAERLEALLLHQDEIWHCRSACKNDPLTGVIGVEK